MKRALRCLGYVLAGIGGVALAACGVCVLIAALFWLSDTIVTWLDLPGKYGILFFYGYMIVGFGVFIGAVLCRDSAL